MSNRKKCQLGDILTFQRGRDLPREQMKKGEYPVVGSNGIIGYHNEYTTEAPSITIGRSGNTGNPFIVYGRSWSHNTTLYVKEFKGSDPIFVYYLLKTLELGSFAGGSAVPTLNRNHIHTLEISVPPLTEQIEIGSTLQALDEKIATNNKINHHLEQQCFALYRRIYNDEFKLGWEMGTVSDLGEVVGGGTPPRAKPEYYTSNGISWITPKDLSINKNKFISQGTEDITDLGLRDSSARLMPRGTVLFSSRAPIGYIAIASGEVCTNQGFKSIIPNKKIGTAFVYFFLKDNTQAIESMASGSTFKEISGSTMKDISAVIPDDRSLADFNEACAPMFKQQELLERENTYLATIRDVLLPILMSGDLTMADNIYTK